MSNLITLLRDSKIIVPPIQRDYAQGRSSGKVPVIRMRFIDSIYNALTNENEPPLELDFIYGFNELDRVNNADVMIFKPLDGQQRLTTLFLIHWFIANKENRMEEVKPLLSKFSYATRESSRLFCEELINFTIDFNSALKVDEQVINQPWFFVSWQNDPTIQSMLVVLRAIHEKFNSSQNLWEKLIGENSKIVFNLLSMDNLGLPDDLYIKMNARGKALTDFEHFKSSFSELLNQDQGKYFNEKIDGEWSDLFWNIFKNNEGEDIAKLVDLGFLNFFWFITEVISTKSKMDQTDDFWLHRVKQVYYLNTSNVQYLFACLDLFVGISKLNDNPFNQIFYVADDEFSSSKTKIFFKNANPNLFQKCVEYFSIKDRFAIREKLFLYAFIQINLNKKQIPDNFYRLLRNLLENASDKEVRNDNLFNLYAGIDKLIDGERNPNNLPFTKRQLSEESDKKALINGDSSLKEIIHKLEDHNMLRGTIGVFDIDKTISELGSTFLNVFYQGQNYFEVSRAMLSFGLYPQNYGNQYLRFGNKNISTWREILTQSDNRQNFDRTKKVLNLYLTHLKENVGISNNSIVEDYINNNTQSENFPIDYYYTRYKSFILWQEGHNEHQTDGFYYWNDFVQSPYDCIMLFRSNFRGRSWSPFLLELSLRIEECAIENYSNKLQFTKDKLILLIEHRNQGFKFSAPDGETYSEQYIDGLIQQNILNENGFLLINQNNNGVDAEDRIEKCSKFLNDLMIAQ